MKRKEMRVFYGSKIIRLTNYFPLLEPVETMVAFYDGTDKMILRFIEFAENKFFSTFYLWSGSEFKEMKKHFFSFFKVIDAAGGVVFNEKNEILVIFRSGKWDLPKGKIDKNETIRDAALREVMEETGLENVEVKGKLMTTHHIYIRKGRMILKPTHWFEMHAHSSSKLDPEIREDISLVTWKSREEMPELLRNTYHSLEDLFNLPRLCRPGI